MDRKNPFYNMRRSPGVPPRWVATVYYRTDAGTIDVEHAIEELDMLHDLIERGPDFHAIERIEIRHARNPHGDTISIEQSRTL